jgi:hypothetical protein
MAITDRSVPPVDLDPVEIRALEIAETWVREKDEKRLARARVVASLQLRQESEKHRAEDPDWMARQHAAARTVSLALTWPGLDQLLPLDVCVPARGLWSIDKDGIYFRFHGDVKGRRQLVCSPVVALDAKGGSARFGVQAGGKWKTVEFPRPATRPPNPGAYVRQVVEQLVEAGLTIAGTVDLSRPDKPEFVAGGEFVGLWLLGVYQGGQHGSPVRKLADARSEAASAVGDSDGRQSLSEALTRTQGLR